MNQFKDAIQGLRNVVTEKNLTAESGEMAALAIGLLGFIDNRGFSSYEILGAIYEMYRTPFDTLSATNKDRVPETGYLPAQQGLQLIMTFLTEELNK